MQNEPCGYEIGKPIVNLSIWASGERLFVLELKLHTPPATSAPETGPTRNDMSDWVRLCEADFRPEHPNIFLRESGT